MGGWGRSRGPLQEEGGGSKGYWKVKSEEQGGEVVYGKLQVKGAGCG